MLALLVAYNLALQFQPIVGGLIAVALIFAVAVVRHARPALQRPRHQLPQRPLRLHRQLLAARFLAYVLGGALIYGSGGILAPLASQWMWGYTLDNLRYGDRPDHMRAAARKALSPVVAAGAACWSAASSCCCMVGRRDRSAMLSDQLGDYVGIGEGKELIALYRSSLVVLSAP